MGTIRKNIQFLCENERSVSSLCRKIEINRQQFARYLSGAVTPSAFNRSKIAGHFGLDAADLFLPHEEFKQRSRLDLSRGSNRHLAEQGLVQLLDGAFPSQSREARSYVGFYHAYYHSFAWPDHIVRSLVAIHEQAGRVFSSTIERLRDPASGERFVFKYRGIVTSRAGRLFLAETEVHKNELINLAILYQTYRSHVTLLSGLTLGMSSKAQRDPTGARIVYEFIGKTIDYRVALRKCDMYPANSLLIAPRIKSAIDNTSQEKVFTAKQLE